MFSIMDEGLPPSIPFLPDLLVHHPEGALVTGMDGEFLWLNNEMQPLTPVSTPHPMRVVRPPSPTGTSLQRGLTVSCCWPAWEPCLSARPRKENNALN